MMKKVHAGFSFVFLMFFLLYAPALSRPSSAEPDLDVFLAQLRSRLEALDFEAYADFFLQELREEQQTAIRSYFERHGMQAASLYPVRGGKIAAAEPEVFLQALFHNSYAAIIETWRLTLTQRESRWLIKEKRVSSTLSSLYKISIPSSRVERVQAVDVVHEDIHLKFRDAWVFYDNIPDQETALVVIGEGRVVFSPSDPVEKHQLKLLYKKDRLEDRLEFTFFRFSSSFFKSKVLITPGPFSPETNVPESLHNRAYSIFSKYHFRYFTTRNSLTGEPLSFLPQGDETVIEFKGKKNGEFTYIYSPFAEEEISLYDRSKNRLASLYSPPVQDGKKRLFIKFSQKFDIRHYDIELDFNPVKLYLSAKARVEVVSQVETLDAVKFKLNPALEILRVIDQDGRELLYTQDKAGELLYIYFLEPVEKQKPHSLEVIYRGKLEPPVQVADVVAGPQFGEPAVFTPPRFDTYLFSQSAHWYPAPQGQDYFTARVRLIVPPEFTCIANGELVEKGRLNDIPRVTELEKVGSAYAVFETQIPVKYLSFLAGKLTRVQEAESPLPMEYYVSDFFRFPRKTMLDDAGLILKFYEDKFGPFPYRNLRIIQRLWSTSGGHSPSSFIILNEIPRSLASGPMSSYVSAVNSPVDLSQWRDYFLAHEVAHQWWGQAVTWAKYRDLWLSEGLAQFAAVLYLKEKHGRKAYAEILRRFSWWSEKKSRWGPVTLGSRLSFVDFEAFQTIVYNKATLVLNMLLDLLEEDSFFRGMKEFFASYKYGPAGTRDFVRVMENAAGRDLKPFFRLWLDSHLLPAVRVSHSVLSQGEGFLLKIRVEQIREAFVFPLWISWREGSRTVFRKVIVEDKTQEYSFIIQEKPKKVAVNPEKAVPGVFY